MSARRGKRPVKHTKARVVAVETHAVEARETLPPAQASAMAEARSVGRAAWCCFSALILVFYFWTATSSNRPFHPRDTSHEFYNQLAVAFQKGQLYLDTKPAPQLLALRDPYSPPAN